MFCKIGVYLSRQKSVALNRVVFALRLLKQSGVEPDMPKTGRRGDFSHFCPCRALARLRSQKQKSIHADTVFGASSLKQNDFCVGKA